MVEGLALTGPAEPLALLRLLQLTSSSLPVGAFAYSQGLEYAASAGWVHDRESLQEWLGGLLEHGLARVDVPLLQRSCAAWAQDDSRSVRYYARYLHAARESAELQLEERQLGRSLARCLVGLGVARAEPWLTRDEATFVSLFALACVEWQIDVRTGALGYCMTWLQNQISAALRLLPIGQLAGQSLLSALALGIPGVVERGLLVRSDDELGFTAPAQVLASTLHETLYTRLFRS